jgi:hypothetical protein
MARTKRVVGVSHIPEQYAILLYNLVPHRVPPEVPPGYLSRYQLQGSMIVRRLSASLKILRSDQEVIKAHLLLSDALPSQCPRPGLRSRRVQSTRGMAAFGITSDRFKAASKRLHASSTKHRAHIWWARRVEEEFYLNFAGHFAPHDIFSPELVTSGSRC